MPLTKEQKQALRPINIVVFFLSVYVVAAAVVDTFFPLSQEVHVLLREVEYGVCFIFFVDFLHRLFTAEDKWKYMRWGWLDLLSSIPLNLFMAGRLFRIFQLVRVVRAIRSIKSVSQYFLRNRIKSAFATVAVFAFVMIVFCAIAILKMEKDAPAGNIKTAEDALWWAYATVTTVGYGDRYPVTPEGRLVAAVLMTVGVGLFGTFTAYVASWFVARKVEEDEEERERERQDRRKRLREKQQSGDESVLSDR